jgi:hypothetical protein
MSGDQWTARLRELAEKLGHPADGFSYEGCDCDQCAAIRAIRDRDAKWRPRCHWMTVSVDGRPVKCGEIERMHPYVGHDFEPPEGSGTDRRALLALLDRLSEASHAE